jgi:DNA ligase-associated metallophosphoesterase
LKDTKFNLLGQNLLLHPYKSVFWKERNILFLSDLHLGKAAHFRKAGIPVPEVVHSQDFDRLQILFGLYNPDRIIFLGDIFHSTFNQSWLDFKSFVSNNIQVRPELVVGNHDILGDKDYSFMDVHKGALVIEPFILSHQPLPNNTYGDLYNLCGHLHPCAKVNGQAKQSFRVPCFYFSPKQGVLPAFGNFTGTSRPFKKKETDQVFLITDHKIIPMS